MFALAACRVIVLRSRNLPRLFARDARKSDEIVTFCMKAKKYLRVLDTQLCGERNATG